MEIHIAGQLSAGPQSYKDGVIFLLFWNVT